jgi:formate hydrogenlyase subunit 3/multisubunit Na+/H+ antiporter MnhD subunit
VFGITQRNPKTVLAYSSVSQMGVVTAALGMGIVGGIAATPVAAAYYALHHVLAKGALFLGVGVAATCGGASRWLALGPAIVLALGFGGMPLTGGWLAKEALKDQLGSGLAGTLAAVSAAGSTLLMLHFAQRMAATMPGDTTSRPGNATLLPWLGLAAAAVLLPWLLHDAAGGTLGTTVGVASMLKALWPVLAGIALFTLLARLGHRLPEAPEGDVILLARRARAVVSPIGPALKRAEAVLRDWPAAGLALLGVILVLGLVLALA